MPLHYIREDGDEYRGVVYQGARQATHWGRLAEHERLLEQETRPDPALRA